jgi:uncharacterized protein YaeQ
MNLIYGSKTLPIKSSYAIEIGQPDERRILKACGRAEQVIVYCYGGQTSKIWWDGIANKLTRARNLQVIAIPSAAVSRAQ